MLSDNGRDVFSRHWASERGKHQQLSDRASPGGRDEKVAGLADNHDNLKGKLFDKIPDVRDGLTREERVVLYVLHETQRERGDRNVPTAMLWGRVCEHFYISPEDLSLLLAPPGREKMKAVETLSQMSARKDSSVGIPP